MKNFLYFAILTTAVVAAWVGFSIYHSSIDSTISQDNAVKIVPITPSFDAQTIENLKSKQIIQPDLSAQKAIPTPTGIIVPTTPTPSAGISNTSSPSGQLPRLPI